MSINKPIYENQSAPITIDAFKNRNCGLGIEHDDYTPPSSKEVKSLRRLIGFSQNELAKFTGVSFDNIKGSTTVRNWEKKGENVSCITPSSWQLMLLKSGLVEIEKTDNNTLNSYTLV